MPVSSSTEHWIKPDALTINLNHFGDPDYLQVSVLAGAVVMAFKQDVIGYNAAHNYRTWPLEAANTYLETTSAYNVYARLTRSEVNARALVVYDTVLRDIEGREITYAEDGSEVLGDANPDYFFVFLGQISDSVNSNGESIQREWNIDFRAGNLDTNQYRNEESTGEWSKMFRLNKVTDLIEVLKTISSAVINKLIVAKELVLFGKVVTDVKRSTDEELSTNDTTIPTTKYLENKFLSKNKDDRSTGIIASDKGFEAGNLVKGATGAGVYKDANDNWVVEIDNLKVRKKLSASDVDIQTTNHIGGQMMLTAASMKVDYVVEYDTYYRCYFLKKDADGNVINNEWKVGDQAYCNTFNLEKQADGTIGNHYYWRKVVGKSSGNESDESIVVGDETINAADYHYVDLSKDDCAVDSSIPKNGDKVVHLGYQGSDDADRQNAIVIAGAGSGSPYIQIFVGINSYSLPEPDQLKPNDNRLSGVLNIKGGSTGWQNFEGLPEEIQKAVDAAEEAKSSYENLEYGKNNLLRNSGFTGDYVTASLGGDTSLKETSQMFSPSLKYWEATNATAQESELSESGKEVLILSGGSLQQTMFFKVIANEKYIFSFRGKGQSITFSVGGYVENISLTSEWASYVSKFTTSFEGQIFSLRVTGDCTLCELQLERGTIKSAWGLSPLDNRSELAKYDSLTYLSNLLKATTTIMGGVVNTGYINMGNLNDKGELAETTAGVSGIYNDESSVAYFAGGNLEKAIYTVATYLDNPNYTPTQEELNNMAKFVVTHGGRAILNDIILRGYIYALGGYFKGEINAEKGVFKNISSPDGSFKIDEQGLAEFLGGNIGSFIVDGRYMGIKADGETSLGYQSVMALLASCLAFNDTDIRTAIGSSVLPPSTGVTALGEFNNTRSGILPNYGLLFNIANSTEGNYAFSGKGNGVLNGMICGYGVQYIETSPNTVHVIGSLDKGNNIVVKVSGVNSGIGLPKLSVVRSALDVEEGDFCVSLNIVSQGKMNIYGKNTTVDGMNSDEYPTYTTNEMSTGGRIVFLIYTNGNYVAYDS